MEERTHIMKNNRRFEGDKGNQVMKLLDSMYVNNKLNNSEILQTPLFKNTQLINKLNRNEEYNIYHNIFHDVVPEWLRIHRKYFSENNLGFGEDAFHSMWFCIFRDFQPKKVLEIGVYRGQIISLWSLLSYNFGLNTEIHGISPFNSDGDEVSTYIDSIDYYSDVINNFKYFNLNVPNLHKGYSGDKEMKEIIESNKWDIIYIDGNHNYDVVKKDFEVCSNTLNSKGLIVLDDSSLYTDYIPNSFSSAGHPGPSALANEININQFSEIISVGHNRVFQMNK